MNGRTAKRIRKEVYGDMAFRGRKYRRSRQVRCIIADPLRQKYQAAKKAYMGAKKDTKSNKPMTV